MSTLTDSIQFGSPPPPLPSTPSSFLTNPSPAFSSSSFLSPASYPSRLGVEAEPSSPHTTLSSKGSKLSWKRGMEKIFRSKSTAGLREAFVTDENQRPPLPHAHTALHDLPQQTKNPLGQPFSSSTPPLPLRESRRENIVSYYGSSLLSPPATAKSETFGLPSHPSLPHDPFASSLDLSSYQVGTSSSPLSSPKLGSPSQTSRPKLSKNSPSLRDLRSLLPRPNKPSLSKAKSMANINGDQMPASAQPERTEASPSNTLAKRMSSVIGLSAWARSDVEDENGDSAPSSITRPTESPPLLPPNPPYFPTSTGMSPRAPSSNTAPSHKSSGMSSASGESIRPPVTPVSTPGTPAMPAPTLSLPPTPNASTPQLAAPISRSGSGAVLLPRSRSTSMSLKAPPTSSSFFDLYEQLGIWPTPEKEKSSTKQSPAVDTGRDLEKDTSITLAYEEGITGDVDQDMTESSFSAQIQGSPSASFSVSSWEAAISAFPMVEEVKPTSTLDFGGPIVGDAEVMETFNQSPLIDVAASEVLSMIALAADSRGATHYQAVSSRASTTSAGAENAQISSTETFRTGRTGSVGISREASGSGGSSRNSSRERWPRDDLSKTRDKGLWFEQGMSSGSSSESDESEEDLDGVPLSQLHPEAAATQRDTQKRRAQRRADKLKMRGRGTNPKIAGRNPGAEGNWDGEGGVPADVLRRRLIKLMGMGSTTVGPGFSASPTIGSVPQERIRTEPISSQTQARPQPALRPKRSFTDPSTAPVPQAYESQGVQRASTLRRPGSSGRGQDRTLVMPRPLSPALPPNALQPLPVIHQRPTMPPAYAMPHKQSVPRDDQTSHDPSSSRPGPSRHNSNATSSSYGHTRLPPVPPAPVSMVRTADVTRSNTSITPRSVSSRQRGRAMSNATSNHHPNMDDHSHARSTAEPIPGRERTGLLVNAFVGTLDGKRLVLEVHPETTAKDALNATRARGDLTILASGTSWVLIEVFAELGCGASSPMIHGKSLLMAA